jgi:hypothetical protein
MHVTRVTPAFSKESRRVSNSVYREMCVRMTRLHFIFPCIVQSQSGQDSDGARSYLVYHFFPFLDAPSKILVVTKYNSYKF